jgi:hypothetical protein
MAATVPARYALGRNTRFAIQYPADTGQTIILCVSDGSIELTADQIEINNNCYSGWKVKLPGNKSGTISVTAFVASDGAVGPTSPLQFFNWFGETIYFELVAYDGQTPQVNALNFNAYGVVTSSRVSVTPDDALRAELTIDISGEPDIAFASLARSN